MVHCHVLRNIYTANSCELQFRKLLLFELGGFWVLSVHLCSWIRIHFNHQHRMYSFRCNNMRSLLHWDRMHGWFGSTGFVYLLLWIRIHYVSQRRMYRCHWKLCSLSRWVCMRGWYYSTCSDMQSRILLLFELVFFWVLCMYVFYWIRIHFDHQHRMHRYRSIMLNNGM